MRTLAFGIVSVMQPCQVPTQGVITLLSLGSQLPGRPAGLCVPYTEASAHLSPSSSLSLVVSGSSQVYRCLVGALPLQVLSAFSALHSALLPVVLVGMRIGTFPWCFCKICGRRAMHARYTFCAVGRLCMGVCAQFMDGARRQLLRGISLLPPFWF